MIDLYLFRHGESEMNLTPELVGGRSNWAKLTPAGKFQAKTLGKRLKQEGIEFDYIYSSPAIRASETANLTCRELSIPKNKVTICDDIQELNQGEWEGIHRNKCYTPETMKILLARGWDFKAPGGESRKEVEQRMVRFLKENVIRKYEPTGNVSIAVFSHGLAIKCLLRYILDFKQEMTYKLLLTNTSITQLSLTEKGWFVERVNDGAHVSESDADEAYKNWMFGKTS